MRPIVILLTMLLLAGCAAKPKGDAPMAVTADPVLYGPTSMKKVDGGYELANRKLRLVINDRTGDVTYFGPADGQKNFLGEGGITMHLANQRSAPPEGYVEKRDDESWQYLGDSLIGVRWRKIYCLHHDAVAVTVLIENRTRDPIDTAIVVRAALTDGQVVTENADLHERRLGGVNVRLQAFNEGKPEKPDWATLIGDFRTLKPDERIGMTMEWKVSGL